MADMDMASLVAQLNAEGARKKQKQQQASQAPQQPKPAGPSVPVKAEPSTNMKSAFKGNQGGYTAAPRAAPPATRPGMPRPVLGPLAKAAAQPKPGPSTQPIGKRLKDVIDFLKENHGRAISQQELREKTGHDLEVDLELRDKLNESGRATQTANGELKYLPQHPHITDASKLLNHVRDKKFGVAVDAVSDSYRGVLDDVERLVKQGRVLKVTNPGQNSEVDVLFPNEDMGVRVDADIRDLILGVQLPEDVVGLQEAVVRAGLRSALAHQPIKRMVNTGEKKEKVKKKRERKINIAKATNVHLPELFKGATMPVSIDEK